MRKLIEFADTRCQWGDVTHKVAWLKPFRSQHNIAGQWQAYDGVWPERRRFDPHRGYFPANSISPLRMPETKDPTETCRAYVVLQNVSPVLIHTNGIWYVGNFTASKHYRPVTSHITGDIVVVSQLMLERMWNLGMVQYLADRVSE